MSTYKETHDSTNTDASLLMQEFPMYGSSRLGVHTVGDSLSRTRYTSSTFDAYGFYTSSYGSVAIIEADTNTYEYVPLYKQYELSNHLGNVLATISAKPILVYSSQNGMVDNRKADITSVSDYYPFGSLMPERHWQSTSYRFGFNGKEADNEIKGSGNSYDFGARIYDSRLGRWLSVDPYFKNYVPISPFVFALNNPISFIDKDGNKVVDADGNEVKISEPYKLKNGTWAVNYDYTGMSKRSIRQFKNNGKVLINAMIQTQKGRDMVQKLKENQDTYHIIITDGTVPGGTPTHKDENDDGVLDWTLTIVKYNKNVIMGKRWDDCDKVEYYNSVGVHDAIETATDDGKAQAFKRENDVKAGVLIEKRKELSDEEYIIWMVKNYENLGIKGELETREQLPNNTLDKKINNQQYKLGETPREVYKNVLK